MYKYLIFLILMLGEFVLTAQSHHLFMYKGLNLPMHKTEQELNLSFGSQLGLGVLDDIYSDGFNIDASYSFSTNYFVFASLHADILFNKKIKQNYILPKSYPNSEILERFQYKVNKNNYALSSGIGYYKNLGKIYFEAIGGLCANRIQDKIQFIKPKGEDVQHSKVKYLSPFVQLSLIRRGQYVDFGISSRFAYNFYGKVQSYNSIFSNKYTDNEYEINKSFNLDIAPILGFHLSKISIYTQFGLNKMQYTNNFDTRLLGCFWTNISIKYSINYKNKTEEL